MQIDIHQDGRWQPCATVCVRDPSRSAREMGVSLRYEVHYALENLGVGGLRALSVRLPVNLAVRNFPRWPSFLLDWLPEGPAQSRLAADLEAPGGWRGLELGAANPAGNLRVRPTEQRARGTHPGFELADMIHSGDAFLDHAAAAGAAVVGASDVCGEAPKFWVIETDEGLWLPDDGRLGARARRYALLKFPDPQSGPRAREQLRLEAAYQRVAQRLGLRVTDDLPRFIDAALLVPRFDRRAGRGSEVRLGVESLASAADPPQSSATLSHPEALLALKRCVSDFEPELMEYLRRDVLNLALGNRDNEPRNTSLLKDTDGSVRLAPLYDFGPSFLDARARPRRMRWDEEGRDRMDWGELLVNLAARFREAGHELGDLEAIAARLRALAHQLEGLPECMLDCGVDEAIVSQRRQPIATLCRLLGDLELP